MDLSPLTGEIACPSAPVGHGDAGSIPHRCAQRRDGCSRAGPPRSPDQARCLAGLQTITQSSGWIRAGSGQPGICAELCVSGDGSRQTVALCGATFWAAGWRGRAWRRLARYGREHRVAFRAPACSAAPVKYCIYLPIDRTCCGAPFSQRPRLTAAAMGDAGRQRPVALRPRRQRESAVPPRAAGPRFAGRRGGRPR